MHFPQNLGFFLNSSLIDLEGIDLWLPTLHTIEIFTQTASHINLVILAFIGAELAGKGRFCPTPSRTRNSEPHSRARVNLAPIRFATYGSLLAFFFFFVLP